MLLPPTGCRAAAAGLAAAFLSELVTQQSVLSQLLGRQDGRRVASKGPGNPFSAAKPLG
jgi:hypothetical protein